MGCVGGESAERSNPEMFCQKRETVSPAELERTISEEQDERGERVSDEICIDAKRQA